MGRGVGAWSVRSGTEFRRWLAAMAPKAIKINPWKQVRPDRESTPELTQKHPITPTATPATPASRATASSRVPSACRQWGHNAEAHWPGAAAREDTSPGPVQRKVERSRFAGWMI